MKDLVLQLLQEKLSSSASSADKRDLLVNNSGRSDLAALVLQRARSKLSDVRKQHFSRPSMTLPFALSTETISRTLTPDDQIREITFKSTNSVEDAPFQLRRYLSIHSVLRTLIHKHESVNSSPNYCSAQIVLDGIRYYDYAVTQRTSCSFHSYSSHEVDLSEPYVLFVDLFYSTRAIQHWLDLSLDDMCHDIFLMVPYERDMWHYTSGISKAGGYRFVWTRYPYDKVDTQNYVSNLSSRYFSSSEYQSATLLIMPYGSTQCLVITRSQFLKLHSKHYCSRGDTSIRHNNHGFAVLSLESINRASAAPPDKLTVTDYDKLYKGYSHYATDMSSSEIMKFYNILCNTRVKSGYYVPSIFIDFVKQIFFAVDLDENYLSRVLNFVSVFTKRLYISDKKYSFKEQLPPDLLCILVEAHAPEVIRIRSKLFNTHFRSVLECMMIGSAKFCASTVIPRDCQHNIDMIVRQSQTSHLEDQLIAATRRSVAITSFAVRKVTDASQHITDTRRNQLSSLLTHIEALFPTSTLHIEKFVRAPIPDAVVDAASNKLRDYLVRNKEFSVSIHDIQGIYDDLFPGNSSIDYTAMQTQAELTNKMIVLSVPRFRVSYANIFSENSERLLIPSKLRTSTAADLTGSFYNMMNALMKRNFNRQAAEMPGDRRHHVRMSILNVLSQYGISAWRELLAYFNSLPISPGMETLDIWASKHTESDVKAANAIMTNKLADPSNYNAMPKNQAKPILDLTAQGSLAVGQTVVFHSKDVISLSVGIFTLLLERLMLLFPTSIRLAFAADEHTVGEWADRYLDLPDTYTYEFDVPKFDKSQDMMCFTLILEVMTIMGVSDDFVNYWRRASYEGTIFNSCFSMVFTLFYGNRSGSGGTLAVNCICLLFAFFTEFSNLNIVAALIKGDDSVLITRRPITNDHVTRLHERWGFSLKRRQINKYVSFCSGLFVKNSESHYLLLRDPVRLLTKLGRALSPDRESSYFIDYYVSFVDATAQYYDDIAVQNLRSAVISLYNRTVDVDSIVQFLRYIVVDYKTFLKVLYGFNEFSLSKIAKLDDIKEIIMYAKTQGFIKSRMLYDKCPNLKIPLAEKIRGYATEIVMDFDDKSYKMKSPKALSIDNVDKLGWIHSMI